MPLSEAMPGVVLDPRTVGDLTAVIIFLQNEDALFRPKSVECGAQARRAAAHDDDVVHSASLSC